MVSEVASHTCTFRYFVRPLSERMLTVATPSMASAAYSAPQPNQRKPTLLH